MTIFFTVTPVFLLQILLLKPISLNYFSILYLLIGDSSMRNKLLFIFLAIVALGLTGCGKEEESTITTIDVDQQQESAVAPAVNSVDSSSQTLLNQNNQVTNEKNTQVNPPALPPA